MKIIYRRTGQGKTTELVEDCIINDDFLVVHHYREAKRIAQKHPELRNRIITFSDLLSKRLAGIRAPIYIDNLDICIEQLFGHYNEIRAISLTKLEE